MAVDGNMSRTSTAPPDAASSPPQFQSASALLSFRDRYISNMNFSVTDVVLAFKQNCETLVEAWVDHVDGTDDVLKLDADARFQFHVGDAATVERDNQPPVRLGPEAEVHVRFAAGQPSLSKSIMSVFEENWSIDII